MPGSRQEDIKYVQKIQKYPQFQNNTNILTNQTFRIFSATQNILKIHKSYAFSQVRQDCGKEEDEL